ncbi:ABC transporter ATP-binding protein [Clostridium saudiense]|uniref:ABC transporter ATP-binding protein n=1 Tax=Clostridium saudiense TaxID=1414720 RepID=UPI00266F8C2A|nr:ABC transporter ATP-binding protein [Clostridium saudiense]
MSILKLENICYQYDGNKKQVLKDINFEFEKGKIYAIVGQSGAGKTTLLSILSSLAKPTSGKIYLNGEDINKIDKYKFRSNHVGVVFQSFNLLTHLTALENVVLSMNISGKKFDNKKETAIEMLKKVGLNEEEANRRVLKLSGGQQQRVAIARALSYDPQIILVDEPTGNLDGKTQDEIMDIFHMLSKEGECIILVTHSPAVAKSADAVYKLTRNL